MLDQIAANGGSCDTYRLAAMWCRPFQSTPVRHEPILDRFILRRFQRVSEYKNKITFAIVSTMPHTNPTLDHQPMGRVKWLLSALVPSAVRLAIQKWRLRRLNAEFADLPVSEIFTQIYARALWGRSSDPLQPHCSGTGSRDCAVVDSYVSSVRVWLQTFSTPQSVVDIGCGDFEVGSKIRDVCGRYIACDVVAPLILSNSRRWASYDVDWKVLDASIESPPPANIAFLRQVLQHLSNDKIACVLGGLVGRVDWVVVTEHLPQKPFVSNIDVPTGSGIRLIQGSGVVITDPPFSFQVNRSEVLADVASAGGRIRTIAYKISRPDDGANTDQ